MIFFWEKTVFISVEDNHSEIISTVKLFCSSMDVELEITFYLPLATTPVLPGFHDSGLFPID